MNSDAADFVLPLPERQNECMRGALDHAGMAPEDVHLVSTHATSTPLGDIQETGAVREVFGDSEHTSINNTKSYIGHTMGAAGSLELAGNLPSLERRRRAPDDQRRPTSTPSARCAGSSSTSRSSARASTRS